MRDFSRRGFIAGAAAVAMMPRRMWSESAAKLRAYVGTYTSAVDGGANGEGIYLFDANAETGELTNRRLVAQTPNPSWIAVHPSKRFLYAINEVSNYKGQRGAQSGSMTGSVSAFVIEAGSGKLQALNAVSSQGAGPAHMSLDTAGKFVFVANYAGGSIAVLTIHEDGSLGEAVDVHADEGSLGSKHAKNTPEGSFAISGHDAPHAHMIAADPQGRFVLATDLGQDRIYVYQFDASSGKLTPASPQPFVELPSGDGPRHFAFHPSGKFVYSLQEEASNVVCFRYDAATGRLEPIQTVSSLPPGFAGSSFASEILITPDGRFLYAANRLHDSIAVFAIHVNGRLDWIAETSTMGDYPRHCTVDPRGRYLYTCDQRSDCIASFAIHPSTGMLSFTGRYTGVGSPAMIAFTG